MAQPIVGLNDPRVVKRWATALTNDVQRESILAHKFFPPPKPLTRRERIVARFRNWCDRIRRAWLVLRHDLYLED